MLVAALKRSRSICLQREKSSPAHPHCLPKVSSLSGAAGMTGIRFTIDFLWKTAPAGVSLETNAMQITENNNAGSRPRAGVRKMPRLACRIDMTPMVDLGFLLISFFVITTELSKPAAMQLRVPADGPASDLGYKYALTVLPADNNRLFYYTGRLEDAVANNALFETTWTGYRSIRSVISERQRLLDADPRSKEKRNGLMLLIKPLPGASYANVVDLLDEAVIDDVKKYALVKISLEEQRRVETIMHLPVAR